jgi:hypothetical protein
MIGSQSDMTVATVASTVDTKSITKALHMMRATKLEKETRRERKQRKKETAARKKAAIEMLENKQ